MEHLHFGARVSASDADALAVQPGCGWGDSTLYREGSNANCLDIFPLEWSGCGRGDYRESPLELLQNGTPISTDFRYTGCEALKTPLPSVLPASRGQTVLAVYLEDKAAKLRLTLLYGVLPTVFTRRAILENFSDTPVSIQKFMSTCTDIPGDWTMHTFSGGWIAEMQHAKTPVTMARSCLESTTGASSSRANPGFLLAAPDATETSGTVCGFNLLYSGSHYLSAQKSLQGLTRVMHGISPANFNWELAPGERFETPEAVMVWSDHGLNGMSQNYHKLYRTRLARGVWRDKVRPILINNWEATYFDFDEEKLVRIAKTAHDVGVELFVLDDGWFSTRCGETSGLGDWWPNTDRLPNGITGLAERINGLGMKFGLWVELEMVNKDSELYRAHPDWILHTEGRHASHGRKQYVLDFSRPEVVDYIHDSIYKVLSTAKVDYIKWDMNRSITECGSAGWGPEHQGEIFHRYILGVYSLYERLTHEFPNILFESCASGGGRFDPGMFYYAPQCWTSDDSDGGERLRIQYGTSYAYPVSFMGAHVSIAPNHQVFRETSLKLRGDVAYFGTFGYELDLGKLSAKELDEVREQICFMKKYRKLIQQGTFYRLKDPFTGNVAAWMVVSDDRRQAIVGYYKMLAHPCTPYTWMKLAGLDETADYKVRIDDHEEMGVFTGAELMRAGLDTTDFSAGEQSHEEGKHCTDFWSRLFVLEAE